MPSKSVVPAAIRQLFAEFPAPVKELALTARQLLLAVLPDIVEMPDVKAKLVGYGYGAGYKGTVATLILSKGGRQDRPRVRRFFARPQVVATRRRKDPSSHRSPHASAIATSWGRATACGCAKPMAYARHGGESQQTRDKASRRLTNRLSVVGQSSLR